MLPAWAPPLQKVGHRKADGGRVGSRSPESAERMLRMDQVHVARRRVVEARTQRAVARELGPVADDRRQIRGPGQQDEDRRSTRPISLSRACNAPADFVPHVPRSRPSLGLPDWRRIGRTISPRSTFSRCWSPSTGRAGKRGFPDAADVRGPGLRLGLPGSTRAGSSQHSRRARPRLHADAAVQRDGLAPFAGGVLLSEPARATIRAA